MSDPTEEPDDVPEAFEEYPGIGRWDNLPSEIVFTKRAGESNCNDGSETQPPLTPEQRESQRSKFTWEPDDVVVLHSGDPDFDDADEDWMELVEQSSVEDRWHGKARDIQVTSKRDPDYKGPTT